MAEVEISPLAKRLAEENNVDWRVLNGSGDDGRIVERDVLDYLARVMAGDEAADPTPEPLPEGVDGWADQPTMASGAGSQDRAHSGASSARSPSGDDDLLEVETGDAAPAPMPETAGDEWSSGDWGESDWSPGAGNNGDVRSGSGEDVFAGVGDLGGGDSSETEESGFDFGGDGGSFDFGGESDGGSFDFASEEPRENSEFDFGGSSGDEETSVFDTSSMEPAIDEGIFVFDDDNDDEPQTGQEPIERKPAAESRQREPFGVGDQGHGSFASAEHPGDTESDTEHTPWEGGSATAAEVEEEVAAAELDGENRWQQDEVQGGEMAASDAPWTAVAEDRPASPAATSSAAEYQLAADEPEYEPAPGQGPQTTGASPFVQPTSSFSAPISPDEAGYDFLDRVEESLPDGVRIEEEEYRVVRSGAAGAAAAAVSATERTATTVEELGPAGRGLSNRGIVLRRDVDLTAVIEAREALFPELGDEAPLVAFLLRAAVRAGRSWPLTDDRAQVGLATLSDDGVSVAVVPAAGEMPFRDLVASCSPRGEVAATPALAVADVSALGIDEAVLDLGMPVVTVGRVLETESGRMRATLTLSGLTTPESGSKFLSRVDELLAAPVRLVL